MSSIPFGPLPHEMEAIRKGEPFTIVRVLDPQPCAPPVPCEGRNGEGWCWVCPTGEPDEYEHHEHPVGASGDVLEVDGYRMTVTGHAMEQRDGVWVATALAEVENG